MQILQIKSVLANIRKVKLRNIPFMLWSSGFRGKDSVFLSFGNFHYRSDKGSKINIKRGGLFLNTDYNSPNPYIGVLKMNKNSTINVEDSFSIHNSCHILVNDNAILNLGSGYINKNAKIRCYREISIGNEVAISENFTVWDTDAHAFLGKESEMTKPVKIGNHVWIGANVTILKGVTIGDGAVIAAGSVVIRNIPPKTLAGGVPAKIIRENILAWK